MEAASQQIGTTNDEAEKRVAPRSSYCTPRRGLSIPAITVLDENERVIEDQQRNVFRYLAQDGLGADIIFAAGTTGEWNRVSNIERQRLIWIATDEVTRINKELVNRQRQTVEAWVGVTAATRT